MNFDPCASSGGNARDNYLKNLFLIKIRLLATGLVKRMLPSEPRLTICLPDDPKEKIISIRLLIQKKRRYQ